MAAQPDPPNRLYDADERAEVHRLFHALVRAHEARSVEHARRLDVLASGLGRRVSVGEVTLADAVARIDAYAFALDPDCPVPLGILHRDHAAAIAREAFARGVRCEREG